MKLDPTSIIKYVIAQGTREFPRPGLGMATAA